MDCTFRFQSPKKDVTGVFRYASSGGRAAELDISILCDQGDFRIHFENTGTSCPLMIMEDIDTDRIVEQALGDGASRPDLFKTIGGLRETLSALEDRGKISYDDLLQAERSISQAAIVFANDHAASCAHLLAFLSSKEIPALQGLGAEFIKRVPSDPANLLRMNVWPIARKSILDAVNNDFDLYKQIDEVLCLALQDDIEEDLEALHDEDDLDLCA